MTDYQNELVMEHLDLVNWVIRTRISVPNRPLCTCLKSTQSRLKTQVNHDACICGGAVSVMIWISYEQLTLENIKNIPISLPAEADILSRNTVAFSPILR